MTPLLVRYSSYTPSTGAVVHPNCTLILAGSASDMLTGKSVRALRGGTDVFSRKDAETLWGGRNDGLGGNRARPRRGAPRGLPPGGYKTLPYMFVGPTVKAVDRIYGMNRIERELRLCIVGILSILSGS